MTMYHALVKRIHYADNFIINNLLYSIPRLTFIMQVYSTNFNHEKHTLYIISKVISINLHVPKHIQK